MSAVLDESTLPTTRTMEVHGHELRVDVRPGDPDRTPLLLCCGIGASFEVLQPLVDLLAPDVTVIRFDVPGVGGSPVPLLPYGFPQLARTAARMVADLGHEQFDVLGFSWGGALAQQLAVQYRSRVRRLVLMSTGTGALMVPANPRVLLRMASPRRFHDPEYAASVAAFIYGGSTRRHTDELLEIFRDKQLPGSRRGYVYQLLAGAVWTSLPFLKLIRQQTLVMAGDDDPIVPLVNGRIMARFIPHAKLHVFEGGHIAPLTDPETAAEVLTEFLSD